MRDLVDEYAATGGEPNLSSTAIKAQRRMLLIGLHGKAGVGKDTAADYLCAQWRLTRMVADRLVEYCKRQHIAALVITDVRFEDEAEWVRSHGGEVWHITRQGAGSVNAHVSESGLPERRHKPTAKREHRKYRR